MAKDKLKSKDSTAQYWWYEFLFRKNITVETPLSPDECAKILREFEHNWFDDWQDIWKPFRIESKVYDQEDDNYTFKLTVTRKQRRSNYSTVEAKGTISDDNRGITVIQITAMFSASFQIVLVAAIAFMLLMLFNGFGNDFDESNIIGLGFVIVVYGIVWIRGLLDRNQLIKRVRDALLREKAKNDA